MRDTIAQFFCTEPYKLQIILSPGRDWKHRPLEYKAESNRDVRLTKFWVALLYRGFLSVAQQPKSGLQRLIVKVSTSHKTRHTQTHTHTHTHGRTTLSERSARRKGRYPHNTQQTNYTYVMPSVGLEHAIPTMKRLLNYAWNSTATGIDCYGICFVSSHSAIPIRLQEEKSVMTMTMMMMIIMIIKFLPFTKYTTTTTAKSLVLFIYH